MPCYKIDRVEAVGLKTLGLHCTFQITILLKYVKCRSFLPKISIRYSKTSTKFTDEKFYLLDITSCNPNPCQNQGQCVNGDNDYICACQAGWTGFNCELGRWW